MQLHIKLVLATGIAEVKLAPIPKIQAAAREIILISAFIATQDSFILANDNFIAAATSPALSHPTSDSSRNSLTMCYKY